MDGYVTIGTELDTKSFDAQIDYIEGQLQEIEHKLKQADMGFEVGDTQKLEAQYERLVNQLENLKKKQADINKADLTSIQKSVEKVGDSTSKVTKRIGKMALAVFGIRSAFMFVRNAINTIASDDEQLKADIDYMKSAIAYTLEPVVRKVVELARQLMFYVGYIAKAWTGKNIFENANKSLKGANTQAKELKKSMASFDEMNILSDNSSSSGGGISTPSFDLTAPEDIPIPSWLQWIADNKDIVIAGLLGIASGLTAIHLGLSLIQGLGIGLILAGVALAIQGIVDFIKDPSWHNFLTILQGVALVVAGIAVLMGGWVVALVAVGVAIVAYIIQNWEKVKEILGKVGNWIYEKVIKPVGDFFVKLGDGIKNGVKSAVDWVKEKFNAMVTFFSNLISKIVGLFKTIGTKVGDVLGGAFKAVINGVLKAIENILNSPIRAINGLISVINKVPGIDLGKLPTFSLPRLAVGGIVNMPSRGVPIGGAIAGESGAEGVIPLTNSQAMETLGQAIGKYVTINANITTNMNGRVISRELQKVNSSSDFAFNR